MKNQIYDEVINREDAELQKALMQLIYFHIGHERAISRDELADQLVARDFDADHVQGTFDRKIRKAILALRRQGHLICSSSGDGGYFVAKDAVEYQKFANAEYRAKIADMSDTLRAMDLAAEKRWGKAAPAGQMGLL